MKPFPTLETGRLLLRQFELTDAPVVHTLLADPEVIGNMIDQSPLDTLADVETMIQQSHTRYESGDNVVFAITRKSDEGLVGYCDLELHARHQRGKIVYWIGRPYWWQGYATEAAKSVAGFGFETLGLDRLYAYVLKRNRASTRVLQKAGLDLEDTRQHSVHKDGLYEDVEIYGIQRAAYVGS
jgi:RimJ/RimL family protein N-acetyltransferase